MDHTFGTLELNGERYQLESVRGAGSFGIVYVASIVRTGKRVGLKRLNPHLGEKEWTAVQKLHSQGVCHKNLLEIIALHFVNEQMFIEMPLATSNLREWSKQCACENERYLSTMFGLLAEGAEGIDYLNGRGFIHRDVKGENFLLGESGALLVADYSVVKFVNTITPSATLAAGTPTLMPFESWDGRPIKYKTDLYSFALTCYQLLKRREVFPIGVTNFELRRFHKNGFDLPELKPAEEKVFRKGSNPNPDKRFANSTEFILALKEAMVSAPANRIHFYGTAPISKQPKTCSIPLLLQLRDIMKTISVTNLIQSRPWCWLLMAGLGAISTVVVLTLMVFRSERTPPHEVFQEGANIVVRVEYPGASKANTRIDLVAPSYQSHYPVLLFTVDGDKPSSRVPLVGQLGSKPGKFPIRLPSGIIVGGQPNFEAENGILIVTLPYVSSIKIQ